jgi:hypothetical protein
MPVSIFNRETGQNFKLAFISLVFKSRQRCVYTRVRERGGGEDCWGQGRVAAHGQDSKECARGEDTFRG